MPYKYDERHVRNAFADRLHFIAEAIQRGDISLLNMEAILGGIPRQYTTKHLRDMVTRLLDNGEVHNGATTNDNSPD